MKQIPIAIIMPSRGLPFARTIEWVEEQRKTYPITLFMSHDLPIPDCFNKLVNKALKGSFVYFLFLEDDIVPPKNAIDKLIDGMAWGHVTCMDYPFRGGIGNVAKDKEGKVTTCGTGCMMVSKLIFDFTPRPYFKTNRKYGGQDVYFCSQIRKADFTIFQVKGECTHLGLTKLGKQNSNYGCHYIGERQKIQ